MARWRLTEEEKRKYALAEHLGLLEELQEKGLGRAAGQGNRKDRRYAAPQQKAIEAFGRLAPLRENQKTRGIRMYTDLRKSTMN